jgi:hypothetical protein
MGDVINRVDAIKHIKAYRDEFKEDFDIDSEEGDDASHHFGYIAGLNRAVRIIEDLPSVEPKKGRWMPEVLSPTSTQLPPTIVHCFSCSACKAVEFMLSRYCPNCGASMEVRD